MLIAAVVSLMTTALSAISGGGWFYWDGCRRVGRNLRYDATAVGCQEVPQVLGYDYQTVERSMDGVYPLLTPRIARV